MLPGLPWALSDAPRFPHPPRVPSWSPCPNSARGTHVPLGSLATLTALWMCSYPISRTALQAMVLCILFLPQKATTVPKKAAGDAGPRASQKSNTSPPFFSSFRSSPSRFRCSSFLPQPSQDRPALQPPPRAMGLLPGYRFNQEDKFNQAPTDRNSAAFRVEVFPGFQARHRQPRCRAVHSSGAVSLGVPGGTAEGVQGIELLPAGRQPLHLPPDLPQLLPPAAVSPAPGLCRDGRWALWSACRGSRNTTPHTTWALVRGMKAKTWH